MSTFRFKQFEIEQSDKVFKVGTDGLLLATWANISEARTILDIGCGTGLIALIAAQRNSKALITAADRDGNAMQLASKNVRKSPWENRIEVIQEDISGLNINRAFDHILSNPPFFSDSTKSPDELKNNTRHSNVLSLQSLFSAVERLLSPAGTFSLIYPNRYKTELLKSAQNSGLFPEKIIHVSGRKDLPVKRLLLSFKKEQNPVRTDNLILETTRGQYTEGATTLLKDFLLKL